jgi:hypothetical protein
MRFQLVEISQVVLVAVICGSICRYEPEEHMDTESEHDLHRRAWFRKVGQKKESGTSVPVLVFVV